MVFLGLLLVLSLFSQTLVNLQTPRVSVGFIASGSTASESMAMGMVTPANTESIRAPVAGIITQVLEPGTDAQNATILFTVAADTRNIHGRLSHALAEQVAIAQSITRFFDDETGTEHSDLMLRALQLEKARVEAELTTLHEIIDTGGVFTVRSGEARTVTAVYTAVGSYIAAGAAVMDTAIRDGRFTVESSFPQRTEHVMPMATANIIVGNERFQGIIRNIIPQGSHNRVYISVNSEQLYGGESVMVTVGGTVVRDTHVIPASALRQHLLGYHILYVDDGYIARAHRVDVIRRDGRSVAIRSAQGTNLPEEPIIINSDKPVAAGDRVRLV
jgi:hypothetical protein